MGPYPEAYCWTAWMRFKNIAVSSTLLKFGVEDIHG